MLDAHNQSIMDEYIAKKPMFEKMREVVMQNIKQLLDSKGIVINAVESRVKAQKSLEGKLELKGYKYADLSDITDILGMRIITFYANEVDKIASLIESHFIVDWENSVDKRKIADPKRFGYMSLHYICKVPKSMFYDEEYPELNEYRFEIQMKTALQHVWSTAEHDTGYKFDIEIPGEYVRALSRLAGLLEIADKEFMNIASGIAEYRRKVKNLIKDGNFADLELNGDTFRSFLDIGPFAALNEKIAAINTAEIQPQNCMPYLAVFKEFDFTTIADIVKLIKEYSEDAYRLALVQIGKTDLDILAETIGVQSLCLAYILKNGGGVMELKKFYDILYGERDRNLKTAQRVLAQAKTINLAK